VVVDGVRERVIVGVVEVAGEEASAAVLALVSDGLRRVRHGGARIAGSSEDRRAKIDATTSPSRTSFAISPSTISAALRAAPIRSIIV
jgi:hypothetical protein